MEKINLGEFVNMENNITVGLFHEDMKHKDIKDDIILQVKDNMYELNLLINGAEHQRNNGNESIVYRLKELKQYVVMQHYHDMIDSILNNLNA